MKSIEFYIYVIHIQQSVFEVLKPTSQKSFQVVYFLGFPGHWVPSLYTLYKIRMVERSQPKSLEMLLEHQADNQTLSQ